MLKIDPNADTHLRHRQNWQKLIMGAVTSTIGVDNVTIENTGSALRIKDLGVSTGKIAADAVTFAKMQNIATDTLIGRDTAGTGDPESIGVTGGIVFTGAGAIQIAAFTGDATKTLGGTALTLATVNSNIGTFNNVTINAKGLATAGSNVAYLTGNETITLSGDATGSGATAIAVTFATVNANVGTFNNLTVNGKGLVTAASNVAYLTANQTITLSGDISGSGTTGIAATIANDAVTNAKLANMVTQTFKGRTTAGSGDPEDLSIAQAKTLLDLTGTNSGDQTITLTGDVTGSGTGSFAATIANDAVTYAKIQNVTDNRLVGRSAGSSGDLMEITVSTGLSLSAGVLTCTVTGFVSPLTTKGDIHIFNTVDARLGVGSNGQMIVADSGVANGLKWTGAADTSLTFSTSGPSVALRTNSGLQIATGLGILLNGASLNLAAGGLSITAGQSKQALVGIGTGVAYRRVVLATAMNVVSSTLANTTTKTSLVAGETALSAQIAALAGSYGQHLRYTGLVSCANAGDTLKFYMTVTDNAGNTDVVTLTLTMAGTESALPVTVFGDGGWSNSGSSGAVGASLTVMLGATTLVTFNQNSAAGVAANTNGAVNRFQIFAQWSNARVTNILSHTTRVALTLPDGQTLG